MGNAFANASHQMYDLGGGNYGGIDPVLYVITGTGFGTKSVTIPYYDDFETYSLGAAISPVGELVLENNQATISATTPRSGTQHLLHDLSLHDFPRFHKALSGAQSRHYLSCGFKFTGITDCDIWKFSRLGAGLPYSGDPQASSQFVGTSGSGTPINDTIGGTINSGDGNITTFSDHDTAAADIENIITPDVWHFYECEFYAGTVDGNDCFFLERFNGMETLTWVNRPMLVTAVDNSPPDWFMTPVCGFDMVTAGTAELDTLYIDESNARVVMTDNAVYGSSTKWAIQPIVSYADTEVTSTRKRQVFSIGETAYLHLFDNSGALVDSGNSFLVAED